MSKKWFVIIAIISSFCSFCTTAKMVAVCNLDQEVCGSINKDEVQFGLLPFALEQMDQSDIDFYDFAQTYLNDIDFDVALLPNEQVGHVKGNDYQVFNLPLVNRIVKIESSNHVTRNVAPKNVCRNNKINIECMDLELALKSFNAGTANLILLESQLESMKLALKSRVQNTETIEEIGYSLLVKKTSTINAEELRLKLIEKVEFNNYQILTIFLVITLITAGCYSAINHYTSKIDQQSGCYAKKTFEVRFKGNARSAFTVMLIDYNNFKKVNDNKGHQIGDQVIERVSEEILKILRKNDKIYRIGGDEFFIEFDTTLSTDRQLQLKTQLEKIGHAVSEELNLTELQFGLSVGCQNVVKGESLIQAYQSVDKAMYEEKRVLKEKLANS